MRFTSHPYEYIFYNDSVFLEGFCSIQKAYCFPVNIQAWYIKFSFVIFSVVNKNSASGGVLE